LIRECTATFKILFFKKSLSLSSAIVLITLVETCSAQVMMSSDIGSHDAAVNTSVKLRATNTSNDRVPTSEETVPTEITRAKPTFSSLLLPDKLERGSDQISSHSFEQFPSDILMLILKNLSPKSLSRLAQVSRFMNQICNEESLWRNFLIKMNLLPNNSPSNFRSKALVIAALRKETVDQVLKGYDIRSTDIDRLAKLGYKSALEMQVQPRCSPYVRAAIPISKSIKEELITNGDFDAIMRKYKGLLLGGYGDLQDLVAALVAAQELNDQLVDKRIPAAIERKANGLATGTYGYKKDKEAATKFLENLIEKGDHDAVGIKIDGLINARYGYSRDLTTAKKLNDELVDKRDQMAIFRKIDGLLLGTNGYLRDWKELKKLSYTLVAEGNSDAIYVIRKNIEEKFQRECNSLIKNLECVKLLIEELVTLDNSQITELKIIGLVNGFYGYAKDKEAAIELNEELIKQGNQKAIRRKVSGLADGLYGYSQIKTFLTSLINHLED